MAEQEPHRIGGPIAQWSLMLATERKRLKDEEKIVASLTRFIEAFGCLQTSWNAHFNYQEKMLVFNSIKTIAGHLKKELEDKTKLSFTFREIGLTLSRYEALWEECLKVRIEVKP